MDPDALGETGRAEHGGSTLPLDFSANTNPEQPPGVRAVYDRAFDAATRYPDDAYHDFCEAAAEYVDCPPDQVVPTAGGTEAIRLALATHVTPGDTVLVPTPSFAEYAREVRLQGATPTFVPHDQLLQQSVDDHAAAVVCTPNNPTGELTAPDELERFATRCREAETLLVVDEAFLDFTDARSVAGTPGVAVCRSLTKIFGLPGLRMGFACATSPLADRLDAARPAWNVSVPAAMVGAYCLRHEGFVARTRERVARERERMRDVLSSAGYDPFPSDAPFLLIDCGDRSVSSLLSRLEAEGIAARDCRSFGLDGTLRVAVKRPPENDRLLEVLTDD